MKHFLILLSSLIFSGCFSNVEQENIPEQLILLWEHSYDVDGGAPRTIPLLLGEYIYSSGDTKITALHYDSGEIVWKTPLQLSQLLMSSQFGYLYDLLVASVLDDIISWNYLTGEEKWRITIPNNLSLNFLKRVTPISDFFVAPSDGNYLYKISLEGELEIIQTDARTYEMSFHNNELFLGQRFNGYGRVAKMNENMTETKWTFDLPGFGAPFRMIPIVENNIVYFGTVYGPTGSQNGFFALDAHTGQEIWRQEGILTFHAVHEGDYIYVNDGAGIYKLRKSDGHMVWYADFRAGAGTAPIAYGYGYIYAPHSGRMHIVNAETGEIVHRLDPPNGSFFWLVTAGKGRIFAQSNRHLYAFAPWGHTEALE